MQIICFIHISSSKFFWSNFSVELFIVFQFLQNLQCGNQRCCWCCFAEIIWKQQCFKLSPSKIAPAQQRKWIDSSAVCIHHYFSNLLSTYLRLLETLGFFYIHSQKDNKLRMIMNTIPTGWKFFLKGKSEQIPLHIFRMSSLACS